MHSACHYTVLARQHECEIMPKPKLYRVAHLVADNLLLTSNLELCFSTVETAYKVTTYKEKSPIK